MGNFLRDAKIGNIGEEETIKYLLEFEGIKDVIDVRDDGIFRNIDIDFLAIDGEGNFIPIEVKTDTMAHRTKNIVYEVYSNKRTKSEGCFEKTKAKYMYYYLIKTKELYKIDVKELKRYVHDTFTEKELKNMGDCAKGYLIKIHELESSGIMTLVNKLTN